MFVFPLTHKLCWLQKEAEHYIFESWWYKYQMFLKVKIPNIQIILLKWRGNQRTRYSPSIFAVEMLFILGYVYSFFLLGKCFILYYRADQHLYYANMYVIYPIFLSFFFFNL